jgi:superfamily II DNA or RNA helicase
MYIGPKGYSIPKKNITSVQATLIKKELTITPFSINAKDRRFSHAEVTYPVYRESAQKIYVPIHYGISKFGMPTDVRLSEGVDISVPFNGTLRDYQTPVMEKAMSHFRTCSPQVSAGLLELPCAWGKTGGSLYLVSQLAKKTLVIVHKEFLMNQWIERIAQFLPTAKVGKIQGSVIDIAGKDIVLCMLQSLSMKDYPAECFSEFGFTIIDEVHHISSQTFSCALFKIVTKYMVGLSATLTRKDGTTNVIKMFLGEVIYKGVREERTNVSVNAYHYQSDDEEFSTTLMDWKGNPMYSSMISKLCGWSHRSDFIIQIISKTFETNPNQQLMVLAHNRSMLTYLHDAIKHRNICNGDVGYYVGGMKESALKDSESKKIIIATYSMAAEALDIKTLTTLVMATPKTDIEQAVGRILRDRHSAPLIIDILDTHGIFMNQWKKRKAYYRKNKYDITEFPYPTSRPTSSLSLRSSFVSLDESVCELSGKCFISFPTISREPIG